MVKKEEASPSRVVKKKTLLKSQKPIAERSQTLQEEAPVVKKIIPPLKKEKPTEEELAEKEREQKKAEKVSKFKSLLSKAKNTSATVETEQAENDELSESSKNKTSSTNVGPKNIQGILGNRKVLKIPKIVDKSQKKGRVVVRICVNSEGKVVSSKYTMMGSTTNDSYLIGLAEKGAKQYLFSPSSNPKECGKVTIDFQLK